MIFKRKKIDPLDELKATMADHDKAMDQFVETIEDFARMIEEHAKKGMP